MVDWTYKDGSAKADGPAVSTDATAKGGGERGSGSEPRLVRTLIAAHKNQLRWREVKSNPGLQLCKVFSPDHAIWSSGFLQIEPSCRKSTTNTKANFLIFSITEGAVDVTIQRSTIRLLTGATFFVPPSNLYSIKTVGSVPTILTFTQVKVDMPYVSFDAGSGLLAILYIN